MRQEGNAQNADLYTTDGEVMAKRGQPTKFRAEFVKQAQKLCEMGATDEDLADFFGVNRTTIWRWARANDKFCNTLKAGKALADQRVEMSLYHKAIGYTFDSVKVFMPANAPAPVYAPIREHVAPDTTAMIFWLKNRKPEEWRDKTDHDVSGHININVLKRDQHKPSS